MKKLILFLAGFLLLVITFVTLFFAGAIYDTAQKRTIDVYFFQPNRMSDARPGVPQKISELPKDRVLNMLIQRYVMEYFTVFPDTANIEQRTKDGALAIMSAPDVFRQWVRTVAPELIEMAEKGMLRTVRINDIHEYGDYYQVDYVTKTWSEPNNMNEKPVLKSGTILLKIDYEPGIRKQAEEEENLLHDYLEQGGDPVQAFKFYVEKVAQQ